MSVAPSPVLNQLMHPGTDARLRCHFSCSQSRRGAAAGQGARAAPALAAPPVAAARVRVCLPGIIQPCLQATRALCSTVQGRVVVLYASHIYDHYFGFLLWGSGGSRVFQALNPLLAGSYRCLLQGHARQRRGHRSDEQSAFCASCAACACSARCDSNALARSMCEGSALCYCRSSRGKERSW